MKNGLIIDKIGNKYWYLNGELHREDGPAIELINKDKIWYLNGEIHREDGPAVMMNGIKEWWYKNTLINCRSQEEIRCSN